MKDTAKHTNHPPSRDSATKTVAAAQAGLRTLTELFKGPLGDSFEAACNLITGIDGRVIVTGVGKSGHIGRKIAATLASTGTSAFFVHPSEANHGDLGMIASNDVILAVSWSGETVELKGIITYATRFSIPLIAITSNTDSTLGKVAAVCLELPKVEEACPNGLAPTTSTIMQLALGDSLAVALLKASGFSADEFGILHPGGSLGSGLTRISEIMHTGGEIPLVKENTSMPEAVMHLSEKRFGCVGIINEDGRLTGIFTDGDLARNLDKNLQELKVDDLMTRTPKTIKPDSLATTAMSMLNKHNISALIVTDGSRRPKGIIHLHDLLRIGVT